MISLGLSTPGIAAQSGRGAAAPVNATLVAGVDGGSLYDGYANNALAAGTWGSLSNTAAPGGEVIAGLHWYASDGRTYLIIVGAGKEAWFTGRKITINGTQYTCTNALSYAGNSYAWVSTSQLFVNTQSYTVSFP